MEEYSWDQKSKIKLIKNLDYSSFNHKTSVIPKNFYEFFGLENNSRDKIQIIQLTVMALSRLKDESMTHMSQINN